MTANHLYDFQIRIRAFYERGAAVPERGDAVRERGDPREARQIHKTRRARMIPALEVLGVDRKNARETCGELGTYEKCRIVTVEDHVMFVYKSIGVLNRGSLRLFNSERNHQNQCSSTFSLWLQRRPRRAPRLQRRGRRARRGSSHQHYSQPTSLALLKLPRKRHLRGLPSPGP